MDINLIDKAIGDILEEYADLTFKVTDKSLDAGAKVLIKNLKANSPDGESLGANKFKNSWKQGKKYKLKRYVGNTKMVKGKKGEVALSNIFEYSTGKNARPFIKRTHENSVNEIANAIIEEVKRGI